MGLLYSFLVVGEWEKVGDIQASGPLMVTAMLRINLWLGSLSIISIVSQHLINLSRQLIIM